jgi:hypothetical protein
MVLLPQHRLLYFFPEPHGQASFRPILEALRRGPLVSGSPLVVQLGKTINRNRRLTAHQPKLYSLPLRRRPLSKTAVCQKCAVLVDLRSPAEMLP